MGSGGVCYGMSQASIAYWENDLAKPYPFLATYSMDGDDPLVRGSIRDHHAVKILNLDWGMLFTGLANANRAFNTLSVLLIRFS